MLLLKFFSTEQYLNDFLDGVLYCNSPEYYRREGSAGIGDRFESCNFFAEGKEQLQPTEITINGYPFTYEGGTRNITVRKSGTKDYYLHCWFYIDPDNIKDHIPIDFHRMTKEFNGAHIALIEPQNMNEFFRRMNTSEYEGCGIVEYSDNSHEWDFLCKSTPYSYQNEFRFLYSLKEDTKTSGNTDAIIMEVKQGFRDIATITNADGVQFEEESPNTP